MPQPKQQPPHADERVHQQIVWHPTSRKTQLQRSADIRTVAPVAAIVTAEDFGD